MAWGGPLRSADLWTGLAIALAGLFLFWMTFGFAMTEEGLVGPRFAPRVISGGLVLGGLILALTAGLRGGPLPNPPPGAASAVPEAGASAATARVFLAVAAIVAIGLCYAFGIARAGYDISTFLAAAAVLTVFGVRGPLRIFAVALGLTVVMHVLFLGLLGLYMPTGRWIELSWIWR